MYVCMQIAQGNMNPAFARGIDIRIWTDSECSLNIYYSTYVRTWFLNSLLTWPSELLQTAIAHTL